MPFNQWIVGNPPGCICALQGHEGGVCYPPLLSFCSHGTKVVGEVTFGETGKAYMNNTSS